jgi:hypothetical protein
MTRRCTGLARVPAALGGVLLVVTLAGRGPRRTGR